MNPTLTDFSDARQSIAWGNFLSQIGWEITKIENTYIFIKQLPLINRSILKIQHPEGPIPFRKIETLAQKKRALFTVIEPHVRGFDPSEFKKNHYTVSKLRYAHSATIVIDLRRSTTELWSLFSENTRRNIRKAEKSLSVTIYPLSDKKNGGLRNSFYRLYKSLGNDKKFYVPSVYEVQAKMTSFAKSSYMLCAYEKSVTEPVAMLWVGSIDKTLIYFHPANTKLGYELLANYLLVWKALQLGKKLKMEYFDFETVYDSRYPNENKRWQGYTAFKRKFGGEVVSFPPSYIKFYNLPFKMIYTVATVFSK